MKQSKNVLELEQRQSQFNLDTKEHDFTIKILDKATDRYLKKKTTNF